MRRTSRNALVMAMAVASLAVAAPRASASQDASTDSSLSSSSLSSAKTQFERTCVVCHGSDAQGTDRAPALSGSRRLRGVSETEIETVIHNGRGGMPAFPLPEIQLQAMARFIRSMNATAFEMQPSGDKLGGEKFFFGAGGCAQCHTALGRGGANGPDLSQIGHRLTLAELGDALDKPGARNDSGYKVINVTLRDGSSLRGFARNRGMHDLQLQTFDGRLHLLNGNEYSAISEEAASYMPAFHSSSEQRRDLMAFLSSLGGTPVGPANFETQPIATQAVNAILKPAPGDWPTYSGNLNGNRYSALTQIDRENVGSLKLQWSYSLPYFGLETTPLVMDGAMYVTGPNQVSALDGRSGRQIWNYSRARTEGGTISGDAAKGANRGVALLGDRVFFITDDAHLICLHRLTGALLWDILMPEKQGHHYGGTSAPLVVGDLVIAGVSGGDEGIRGFVAAYKATTGERVWQFWTVPLLGEPGSETWRQKGNGTDPPLGGATWVTGSYDSETGILYWTTGNPYPDTDGDNRGGDNLFTDCDIALDAKTGKLLWYFQFTPHDLHDWDANQPLVLADAEFHGQRRKLLLHANRNGFLYVLDRTNGKLLQAAPLVKKLTWSSGIGEDGRPKLTPSNETTEFGVKTCPAVRGATNWYSTAYNPATNLYYVMTVEDCTLYRKAHDGGYGRINDPQNPGQKVLRAFDIESGKMIWELPFIGPVEANYSGVLATAGGIVFAGETTGGFAAVDARTGKSLWHFEANQPWKASPMTYIAGGRQYVAIASGANILSFALSEPPSDQRPEK